MIMAREDDGARRQRPEANHWWKANRTGNPEPKARIRKLSLTVTMAEATAIRAHAGRIAITDFLRENLPPEIFVMPLPPSSQS